MLNIINLFLALLSYALVGVFFVTTNKNIAKKNFRTRKSARIGYGINQQQVTINPTINVGIPNASFGKVLLPGK
jgi:hypothetical protein